MTLPGLRETRPTRCSNCVSFFKPGIPPGIWGMGTFPPVIVQVSVEQVLQAVLQAVQDKLSMEIQATGSAVFWNRVRVLQDSPEAPQPLQQELKIFQLRTDKNSLSVRKKKAQTLSTQFSLTGSDGCFQLRIRENFPLRD